VTRDKTPQNLHEAGFTLLEILIVVTIIGLLMAVVGTQLVGRAGTARHDIARTQVQQLESALAAYELDNGRYPTAEQGLMALVQEPQSDPRPRRYQPGGYAKHEMLTDPWGSEYFYEIPGLNNSHSFDLYTLGADAAKGGEGVNADIGNWYAGDAP